MKTHLLSLSCMLGSLFTLQAAESTKPNIVLIYIDDMGYGDIGPFGSTQNRTPNLDRMAKEGMKLTSFYAAPLCSVSRAQVMTGCYGQRVSILGALGPGVKTGINSNEHTVAELLKEQGYATMCIGKWHLGDQPEFMPIHHGFDDYFGIPYSNDMMLKAKEKEGNLVVPLVRGDKAVELLEPKDQDRLVERYTDEAVKFITAHQSGDHPFFLYLPHNAVHGPHHPGEKFQGHSNHGVYNDWVEEVDWSVGRVLDTLRELKLDSNTFVMFCSDNGPAGNVGSDNGVAGPLRGRKASTWEGGMREPTLAWWPGKIAAGSSSDAMASNIDFLPTFVKLAGGTLPTDNKIDGLDISPLLLGETKTSPHEALYYYNAYQLQAVRSGPWKLAVGPQHEGKQGGVFVPGSMDKPRLYQLDDDIGEQKNVADDHPDVVARLKKLLEAMTAQLGTGGKPGPEVRASGEAKQPEPMFAVDRPKAVAVDHLKIGASVGGDAAPQVERKPIEISCEIETTAKDGVIVAHGGTSAGYALYLKGGHLVFAVKTSGKDIARITSEAEVSGKASIKANLAKDGAMTLAINDKPAGTAKATSTLPRQPGENFCVGFDESNPVDEYDGAALFKGEIRNLSVETPGALKYEKGH